MEEQGNFSDTYVDTGNERVDAAYADDYDERYDAAQRLCAICHEHAKDTIESPNSDLCYDCRQDCLKLRIPTKIKIFMALVLAVFLVSLIGFFSILPTYRLYVEADRQMEAREYVFAYHNYSKVLEKYSAKMDIPLGAADAAMASQYFEDAAAIFNEYVIGKEIGDYWYETVTGHIDFLDSYYMTMQEINVAFGEISESADMSDVEKLAEAFHGKLSALLEHEGMNKAIIYYYLGTNSVDAASSLEYLRLASETDPRVTFPLPFYGNVLRSTGNLDEAKKVYTHALEVNATDALSIRGLSILSLLEGDKAFALQEMRRACAIDPNGLYMPESLVIALCENGLRDEAMTVLEPLDTYSREEDLQAYLDGSMSLRDYYIKGEQA